MAIPAQAATVPEQQSHSRDEEWNIREAALDETIEASFPASDPPSTDPNPNDVDALLRHSAALISLDALAAFR